ncbi:MAG: MerR family transcriptional regulator [Erysipelotrichaceae bacterium]
MKDYYQIGEISKLYGIGKDSLMYYEELGILTPIRGDNGYRYYKISDIYRLNLIKELRSLDFSMQRIKEFLDHRSVESTKVLLKQELELIEQKQIKLENDRKHILKRYQNIEHVLETCHLDEIETIYIERRKALQMDANITREEDFDFLIKKLQNKFEDKFFIIGNQSIGSQFDAIAFKDKDYNKFKSIFVLLDETSEGNFVIEEGYYIRSYYRGSYLNNKSCITKMLKYIKEKGYHQFGDPLEIYKIDIHQSGNVNEYITEVQIPVLFK